MALTREVTSLNATLLTTLLMAQSWIYATPDNAPLATYYPTFSLAWSISTEMFLYFLFPGLVLGIRRIGPLVSVLLMIVCSIFYALAFSYMREIGGLVGNILVGPGYVDEGETSVGLWLVFHSPFGRFFQFVAGALTCHAYLKLKTEPSQTERKWGCLLLLQLIVALTYINLSDDRAATFLMRIAGNSILIAPILFCLARYRTCGLTQFIGSWPLVALGTWSYGIYLLQFFVSRFVHVSTPEEVIVFWLATIGVAAATYEIIERPARGWLKRLNTKHSHRSH